MNRTEPKEADIVLTFAHGHRSEELGGGYFYRAEGSFFAIFLICLCTYHLMRSFSILNEFIHLRVYLAK
jgi:hypothetical protein